VAGGSPVEELPLAADVSQLRFGIAGAGGATEGSCGVNPAKVFVAQRDVRRGEVLLEICAALRAGYWHDVAPLAEDPRQRELPGRDALFLGDRPDAIDQLEVPLEVLPLEAGVACAVLAPEVL